MNIEKIMKHLPHRYPFLMVDRVLEFVPDESLTALKNVSINEPYFQGHFPGKPIMPGVLILEALAQASGLYAFSMHERGGKETSDYIYMFVTVDNAKFRHPVVPGDQVTLRVEPVSYRRGMLKVNGEAKIGDKLVATATLMCAEQEIES